MVLTDDYDWQTSLVGDGTEPNGLCANREEHRPHLHESASLGTFWCSAIQSEREPYRSEARRAAH